MPCRKEYCIGYHYCGGMGCYKKTSISYGSIPRAAKDILFLMSTLPAFLELTKTYDIKQQETMMFAFS